MSSSDRNWFDESAAVMLLMTALAKLYSSGGNSRVLQIQDKLLHVGYRPLLIAAALIEVTVALFLLGNRSELRRSLLLLWLSANFLCYHLGNFILGYHTGCSLPALLFRPGAERLGLTLKPQQFGDFNGHRVPFQLTQECLLELPNWGFWSVFRFRVDLRVRTPFLVMGEPDLQLPGLDPKIDGVLGWPILRHTIVQLDASHHKVQFLSAVPKQTKHWLQFSVSNKAAGESPYAWSWHYPLARRIVADSGLLELELPDPRGGNQALLIDTGDSEGISVQLSQEKWREWKAAHSSQATALSSSFTADGVVTVRESGWADVLNLGPLNLKGVSVGQASFATNHIATLSFEALKHIDLIIDGRRGRAYLRPLTTPERRNALDGPTALFAPRDLRESDLVAHVLDTSAAFASGIRNGDLLLKIDGRNIADWRARPGEKWRVKSSDSSLWRASNEPAATTVEMTLRRHGDTFETMVAAEGIGIISFPSKRTLEGK